MTLRRLSSIKILTEVAPVDLSRIQDNLGVLHGASIISSVEQGHLCNQRTYFAVLIRKMNTFEERLQTPLK